MPTFKMTLAQTVQVYGNVTIEAPDAEAAAEMVRAAFEQGDGEQYNATWFHVDEPDLSSASHPRIVVFVEEDDDGMFLPTWDTDLSLYTSGDAFAQMEGEVMSKEELAAIFADLRGEEGEAA